MSAHRALPNRTADQPDGHAATINGADMEMGRHEGRP